ncbi:helix-turn-helix transcriptional regulator [Phormidium sp. FACHB-592]|nr:helix-turn-helix transcriptional regulator [Phormidium sp. FACHB-592]
MSETSRYFKYVQYDWKLSKSIVEDSKPQKQYMCPVEALVNIIGGKWKLPILTLFFQETKRYGELRQPLPGVTERMVTMQLRELERSGIVQRKVYAEVPLKVEYSLTALGHSLEPVLQVMLSWSERLSIKLRQAWERGMSTSPTHSREQLVRLRLLPNQPDGVGQTRRGRSQNRWIAFLALAAPM